MATKITNKPSAPSNVTISRSGSTFTATWKKATTTGSSAVQKVRVWFQYKTDGDKSWTTDLDVVEIGATRTSYSYTISDWNLLEIGSNVKAVRFGVDFKNSKGNSDNAYASITFKAPTGAAASVWAGDDQQVHYSATLPGDTQDAPVIGGSWVLHRTPQGGSREMVAIGYSNVDSSLSRAYPINPDTPTLYEIHAIVNGTRGSSSAYSSRVMSKPSKPTVENVSKASTSYTVSWSYDSASGWRPVDKFEVLYGDTEQSATSCGSWTSMVSDVGAGARSITRSIEQGVESKMKRWFMVRAYYNGIPMSGDGKVFDGLWGAPEAPTITANANVVTVKPTANHSPNAMVYVEREQDGNSASVMSYMASEGDKTFTDNGVQAGAVYRYSAYIVNSDKGGLHSEVARSESFVTPNEVFLKAWSKSDDCETAFLSWDAPSGVVDGYEIAWAEKPDAFKSNQEPSTMDVEGGETTAVRISGLTPGKTYWFWIRSVASVDENEGKGNWNNQSAEGESAFLVMANPPDKPNPILSASYAVAGIDDTSIGWNYSALGDSPITGWSIRAVHGDDDPWTLDSDSETFLDGSATIASSTLAKGTWLVYLTLTNMAGSTTSDPVPLKVVTPPEVSITSEIADGTVTALPIAFAAVSAGYVPVLEVIATKPMQVELPGGTHLIFEGEVVWSGIADGSVSISPQLYENGEYFARAYAVDDETGLVGYSAEIPFGVAWAHQAEAGEAIVTPNSEDVSCTVTVEAPENALETDYCSLWRVTADGASLVSDRLSFGSTVLDPYAPYGSESCAYRVCTHTKDGDFEFADFENGLQHESVRIDYGGNHVELPYNITSGDKRAKDNQVRKYLDGSKSAAIRRGITRTHNITSDLIRSIDEPMVESCYSLSRYEGVCFVRVPSGVAYAANVNVSIDRAATTSLVSISIDAEEVDYSGEFAGTESTVSEVE